VTHFDFVHIDADLIMCLTWLSDEDLWTLIRKLFCAIYSRRNSFVSNVKVSRSSKFVCQ
jgi:hypothetical protein